MKLTIKSSIMALAIILSPALICLADEATTVDSHSESSTAAPAPTVQTNTESTYNSSSPAAIKSTVVKSSTIKTLPAPVDNYSSTTTSTKKSVGF